MLPVKNFFKIYSTESVLSTIKQEIVILLFQLKEKYSKCYKNNKKIPLKCFFHTFYSP
jgi:hypothetical protein